MAANETAWDSNYPVVVAYQAKRGTLDGLSTSHPTAGRWLTRWRQADAYLAEHGTLTGINERYPAEAKQFASMLNLSDSEIRLRLQQLRRIGALHARFASDELIERLAAWLDADRDHTVAGISPDTTIETGGRTLPLGALVDEARRLYPAGQLDPQAISAIKSVPGWTWTKPDPEEVFLAELDWWVARHGDARVPQLATSRLVAGKPYPLGRRVNSRRANYAKGTLSQAQLDAYEQRPGWAWDASEATWMAKRDQVAAYVAKTGTLTGIHSHDSALGLWLNRQQRDWDSLTPARRTALTTIPGLDPQANGRSATGLFLEAATAWLQANPTAGMNDMRTDVIVDLNGSEIAVGRQASYIRSRYADGKISPDDAAQIETLRGWTWTMRKNRR